MLTTIIQMIYSIDKKIFRSCVYNLLWILILVFKKKNCLTINWKSFQQLSLMRKLIENLIEEFWFTKCYTIYLNRTWSTNPCNPILSNLNLSIPNLSMPNISISITPNDLKYRIIYFIEFQRDRKPKLSNPKSQVRLA